MEHPRFTLTLSVLALSLSCFAPAQELPQQRQPLTLQIHDVRDLIGGDADKPAAKAALEGMAEFLSAFADPTLAEGEEISAAGTGALAVRARGAVHTWLEQRLGEARAAQGVGLEIDTHYVEITDRVFKQWIAPLAPDAKAGERIVKVMTDAIESKTWLRGLSANEDVLTIHAPRLLVRPLSMATMSTGNHTKYVREYEIDTEGKAHPVHDTVFDGMVLISTAMPIGEDVALSFRFEEHGLERPIQKATTNTNADNALTIELPKSRVMTFEQALKIPDGATVLTHAPGLEDKSYVFMIRVRRIALDPVEPVLVDPLDERRRER